MFDGLEVGNGPSKLLPQLGIFNGHIKTGRRATRSFCDCKCPGDCQQTTSTSDDDSLIVYTDIRKIEANNATRWINALGRNYFQSIRLNNENIITSDYQNNVGNLAPQDQA